MEIKVNGDTLMIKAKLDKEGTLSTSGKSRVVASTHGNVPIPGTDLKMGLNVYRPVKTQ